MCNIIEGEPLLIINTKIDHEINAVSSLSLRCNSHLHSLGDIYQFKINIKIVSRIHVSSRVPDSMNARYKAVQPHEIES